MTLLFSVGRWGGIYFYRGYSWRLCLGWVAVTFIPRDIDDLWPRILEAKPQEGRHAGT